MNDQNETVQTDMPAMTANPPIILDVENPEKIQQLVDVISSKPAEQAKQEDHPNLNAGGPPAPEGNNYAEKFTTPEERKDFLDAYCKHIEAGYSDDSFSFRGSGIKVFKAKCEKYPTDFPSDIIENSQAQRMIFWERIGMNGTMGIPIKYKDSKGVEHEARGRFNDRSWQFNMQNRFKSWKIRTDVTTDDEKIETPIVYIPEEKD